MPVGFLLQYDTVITEQEVPLEQWFPNFSRRLPPSGDYQALTSFNIFAERNIIIFTFIHTIVYDQPTHIPRQILLESQWMRCARHVMRMERRRVHTVFW
jgi:hypothetical protein